MLNHWLANMEQQPPDQWHVADIFLMPKPHKAIMAASLRPISLLDPIAKAHPIAKALASILKQKIQPAADKLLAASPQFAYMEHRSVADALDRVLTHLVHVRNILQTQRQTPHLRQQGHTPAPCRGGITFSVDLQKAFDCMSRTHLAMALEAAGIETSLRWTILQLHKHACMRFSHAAATTEIPTTNGIRQGCGLSPTLWAMFTQVVMQKICERLHQDGITVYADDWLFQWYVESANDFTKVLADIGYICEVLQEFGLSISPEKSVVLLGIRGSSVKGLYRQHTSNNKHGKVIHIPLNNSTLQLPLVEVHTYLGVRISYRVPEAATLKYRMKESWSVFNRLMPALRSASLSIRQKLAIWKACVYATLMHGLDSTGSVHWPRVA